MKRSTMLLAVAIGLAGSLTSLTAFATDYEPPIDLQGVDQAKYKQDLSDCQTYAEKEDAGKDAAVQGGVAAATGAALGGIFGGGIGAAEGGASGAVSGGASGGMNGVDKQHRIVDNCLRGRGYKLLD